MWTFTCNNRLKLCYTQLFCSETLTCTTWEPRYAYTLIINMLETLKTGGFAQILVSFILSRCVPTYGNLPYAVIRDWWQDDLTVQGWTQTHLKLKGFNWSDWHWILPRYFLPAFAVVHSRILSWATWIRSTLSRFISISKAADRGFGSR